MLIEIHVLQNHSPSNPNRDDLGAPKTAMFGGVLRARISSQCLKRSIRSSDLFRELLPGRIGIRTRLFPHLVGEELKKSKVIPEDEHRSIVVACQRIATDKEASSAEKSARADARPKTPQLIFLGPGHAAEFVRRLEGLRQTPDMKAAYDYFLNPVVGFQELVREKLKATPLDDKHHEKIIKAAWCIARIRLNKLPAAVSEADSPADAVTEPGPEPATADVEADSPVDAVTEPGPELAELIAVRLADVFENDLARFKELTKRATAEEKKTLGDEAPDKPRNMAKFLDELAAANQHDAVDIGLFGRMTTSDAFENVEAAMEVAHAISTNQVQPEVDYFTAVDDLDPLGAGHIGENQFNSSTFYKYFSLDWDALVHYLAGDEPSADQIAKAPDSAEQWRTRRDAAVRLAADAVEAFIKAAAFAVPTGKKKGHANNNLPDGILVELKRTHIPTSYANAFLIPARHHVDHDGRTNDVMADSIRKLAHYVGSVVQGYRIAANRWWFTTRHDTPFRYQREEGQPVWQVPPEETFDALIARLRQTLTPAVVED